MLLTTTAGATPAPMPIMKTTGPKDWVDIPLATFEWTHAIATRPVYATTHGFVRLDGVKDLASALHSASRLSLRYSPQLSLATAVLQARDGTFYISTLGEHRGSATGGFYFPATDKGVTVKSVTPHVDALKAIVGGTTWVRFDSVAGEPPAPTDVSG